jgi:hypothetical protein
MYMIGAHYKITNEMDIVRCSFNKLKTNEHVALRFEMWF